MSSLAASSSYCERDVARIMRQLVDAVRHVHAQVGAGLFSVASLQNWASTCVSPPCGQARVARTCMLTLN
jgi:hypothetical protein